MCGIFGFSTKNNGITPVERACLIAGLGPANDNRGGDSWGVYAYQDKPLLHHGLGKMRGNFYFPFAAQVDLFMGHTRKATTGAPTIPNAHPFTVGNVIGAHNGYISNHDEMNKKYNRKFEVDSMHIFAHIFDKLDVEELIGWGAIEYASKRAPRRCRLVRFSGGALEIRGICRTRKEAEADNATSNTVGVAWSSSEWALKDSLELAGLLGRSFPFKLEADHVYIVADGVLQEEVGRIMKLGTHSARAPIGYTAGDFCGEYDQEKWRPRNTHTSTAYSGRPVEDSLGKALTRKARREGRFGVITDPITTVYTDTEAVRKFFDAPAMETVKIVADDEDGQPDEAALAKQASAAVVAELEAGSKDIIQEQTALLHQAVDGQR